MKHRLQTFLRHKLQWLVLLTALLGVSQGVWGWTDMYIRGSWDGQTQHDINGKEYPVDLSVGNYCLKLYANGKWLGNNGNYTTVAGATVVYAFDENCTSGGTCSGGNCDFELRVTVAGTYKFSSNTSKQNPELTIQCPGGAKISGDFNSWSEEGITSPYSCPISSTGTQQFVIIDSDGTEYKAQDFTRCDNSKTLTTTNTNATVDVDLTGDYTFTWNSSTKQLTITYPTDACHPDCSTMEDIINEDYVMYYIYQSYGGTLKVTNNTKKCITSNTTYTKIDNNNVYVLQSTDNVPSNLRVSNNCDDWEGSGNFSSVTASNAQGAKFNTGASSSKINATTITVTPSADEISVGTTSITLTMSDASGTTSSYGSALKSIVYVCSSDKSVVYNQAANSCQNVTSSDYTYTLSTSSLAAGTYKIVTILTDGTVHYIGDEFTLTVNSCTPPESSYFSVTDNMYTYDGEGHYATVTYSGVPAAYTPSVTATYGSGKASSVSAAGEYDIYVSASASSTYCDVTDLKLTGEGQKLIICAPPIPGFSASAGSNTLYFSNGDNVSTTLSTAANSNWEYEWFCTQSPTYSGTTYSPSFSSYTSNSTTVTFPIEGVYKFKVKARCTCDTGKESAWVESTEVTVTVHLKLHLKGPITCSACAFTGDCETYTAICDLTNTNTVTYNFIGYYKNNADYKGEFCINASNSAGDGNHIHTSDTYTYNNLNLTAGITYNTSHNYNLMSDGLTIAETGTPLTLTITHTGGKNYTLSLARMVCPDISIKTQPSTTSQILCKNGTPTDLTVEGQGGTTPYTYQWYQNTENATSGATMVSGATSATITPATTATGTLYYYCVVSSAGLCSDKKATSNVSGGVTVATPKLTASATSVTNFTPVTITSDVVLNGTKFTIDDVQSTDSYLYENTTVSVIFKGDVGDDSSKTFTISGTARDVSCSGSVDITVSKDANSCD